MSKITYFNRLNHCWFGYRHISIEDIFQIIKSGDLMLNDFSIGSYTLRQITEAIRQQTDTGIQDRWKSGYCPAVSFNGIWGGQGIVQYSQYTALDFDKINSEQEMNCKMETLKSTPYIVALFRTFKTNRFKAIALHNNTDLDLHSDMYEMLMKECGADSLDASCKDLSRRSYLAWDENIWVNPNPVPYNYIPSLRQVETRKIDISEMSGKEKSPQSIICILNAYWKRKHPEYWKTGNRATSIFKCACQLCEYGVPQDLSEIYFLEGGWIADDFDENEVVKQVKGAYVYKRNEYGSKFFK